MRLIISKIRSSFQNAFVPHQHIQDNILLTHEILHSMRKSKSHSGSLAIKLDLSKAYGQLEWDFIRWSLSLIMDSCLGGLTGLWIALLQLITKFLLMEGLQILYFPLEVSEKVILFPLASLLRILSSGEKEIYNNLTLKMIIVSSINLSTWTWKRILFHKGYFINTPRIIYVLKVLVKLHQQVSHQNAVTRHESPIAYYT